MVLIYTIIGITLILCILIYVSNNMLKVTEYRVVNSKIPKAFNNLNIVQISDTHSKMFGKNNEKLIKLVESTNPDIIVMSGDIIAGKKGDIQKAIEMFKPLYQKYPVYYSIGNHELMLDKNKLNKYLKMLENNGVKVLIDNSSYYEKNGEKIRIIGINYDENANMENNSIDKNENFVKIIKDKFNDINKDEYNILIAHDPENFELYEKIKPDLIFSGHDHGGLIRFGKVALLSPRKKFFPKYAYGKNTINDTTMITSSGIGNARIPIRLFNRPEIVKVILKNE
ncbi:MAG: metallophosphoesterase [Clostridia bacterium]|nr:metallophosphoesterase [Clostridia bacterium]